MTDLQSAFAAPEPIQGTFRHGLALIAQLDEQQQKKLLVWVRSSLGTARREERAAVASALGIPAEHDVPVRVAATIMAGTLADPPASTEDFIEAGLATTAFSQAHAFSMT